jgi:hypothetical protein
MEKAFKVSYWWKCEKIKGEIPLSLQNDLDEYANKEIAEKMKCGFICGQLFGNFIHHIHGKRMPLDGWECQGFWSTETIDATLTPKAITKPYTKKEAKKLFKNNHLKAVVALNFSEITSGIDAVNDAVSEMILGSPVALEDIDYKPVGVDKNENILIEVSGSIESWLENKDGE